MRENKNIQFYYLSNVAEKLKYYFQNGRIDIIHWCGVPNSFALLCYIRDYFENDKKIFHCISYILFYSYICKTLKNYFTLRKNADSYSFGCVWIILWIKLCMHIIYSAPKKITNKLKHKTWHLHIGIPWI